MIRYHFDLYPRDDPHAGARVVRFTKLQSAEYRGEANGTGSGRFSIRADTTEAQFIDPRGLQYVRVVREDTVAVTELVVGGFFLDSGDFSALDERGTRLLTFGGAGTLSYLARAIMWSHTYISSAGYVGQDPFDDTWRLYAQWDTLGISGDVATGPSLGGALWRVIYEAQHFTPGVHKHGDTPAGETVSDTHADDRTENALPDLTLDFDWTRDSNGTLFTETDAEFKAQVGENVLQVVKRLMELGLYVSMDPDTFVLSVYPASTHRRDRTGVAWGASVIRFQAPTDATIDTGNIKSDARRAIAAFIKRSVLLAGGNDVYGDAVGTTDIPWEGFYYTDVQNVSALQNIAGVQLGARDDAGDTLRLRGRLGNDPTNGIYKPFEHVLLDDLGTIHTGTGQWDYNEQDFPVAAITVMLRAGGDWDVWYDMGSSFSATDRRFQVTPVAAHNHPPNPQLCNPGTPGTSPTVSGGAGVGTNGSSQSSVSVPASTGGLVSWCLTSEGMAAPTATWKPNSASGASDQVMAIIGTVTHPTPSSGSNKDGEKLWIAWLANPNASTVNNPGIVWDNASLEFGSMMGYATVSSSDAPSLAGNYGTGATASVNAGAAGPADRVIDVHGYRVWSMGDASNTPSALSGQTTIWAVARNNSVGQNDSAWYGGHSVGPGTREANLVLATNWVSAAVIFAGVGGVEGDCPQDVGHTCDVGTANRAARCDHVHAHGYHSTDEAHAHDAADIEVQPVGPITATNAQDALAQVVSVASSSSTAPHSHPDYAETASALTSSPAGGWNQISEPRSVIHRGYVYAGGAHGDDGDVSVQILSELDPSTPAVERVLHSGFTANTHNNPALWVDETDHKLVAFYSDHDGAALYMRVSTNSLDTDPTISGGFAAETDLDSQLGGTAYTYPSVLQLPGESNKWFLFVKPTSTDETVSYSTSTDRSTWSALTSLAVTADWCYVKAVRNGDNRIDFLVMTDHPISGTASVGHFYYDGTFHASDGTAITLPASAATITTIHNGATDGSAWIWDIAIGLDGLPRVAYSALDTGADHVYHYARWTGSEWVTSEIAHSVGHIVTGVPGGIALDRAEPTIAHLIIEVDGVLEPFRAVTPDGGATWQLDPLAEGSSADNMLPAAIHSSEPETRADPGIRALWMFGTYTDFDDYLFGLSGSVVGGASSGASALDGLTDVTISSATTDDDLRYNGTAWVNDARKWEAVTNGEDVFVWDGDNLVHDWSS